MSEILGADGRRIADQVAYPLGPNILALPGTPEQLFRDGFGVVDANGQFHIPSAMIGLWASASAAYVERAQHAHNLECRIAAMERLLKKHRPDLHEEYIAEFALVQKETQERARQMQREGFASK